MIYTMVKRGDKNEIKIGRGNPNERRKAARTWGDWEYYRSPIQTDNDEEAEKWIHRNLRRWKVPGTRELFQAVPAVLEFIDGLDTVLQAAESLPLLAYAERGYTEADQKIIELDKALDSAHERVNELESLLTKAQDDLEVSRTLHWITAIELNMMTRRVHAACRMWAAVGYYAIKAGPDIARTIESIMTKVKREPDPLLGELIIRHGMNEQNKIENRLTAMAKHLHGQLWRYRVAYLRHRYKSTKRLRDIGYTPTGEPMTRQKSNA